MDADWTIWCKCTSLSILGVQRNLLLLADLSFWSTVRASLLFNTRLLQGWPEELWDPMQNIFVAPVHQSHSSSKPGANGTLCKVQHSKVGGSHVMSPSSASRKTDFEPTGPRNGQEGSPARMLCLRHSPCDAVSWKIPCQSISYSVRCQLWMWALQLLPQHRASFTAWQAFVSRFRSLPCLVEVHSVYR